MARLRSVNGVDAKAARLIRRAGKDFEIQTHGRSLYAKASDVETRSFKGGLHTLSLLEGGLCPSLVAIRDDTSSADPARAGESQAFKGRCFWESDARLHFWGARAPQGA